ncbi:MAG: ATP-dependent Clp protease ATP-binding subunit [Bacteroidaceae bacterium]|nr:ATP-dependent Clp protease ATP-binding subunit [Bacteroidaceae bacterium]
MNNNYSQKITQILQYSKEEAIRLNNDYIGPEHIMLGILRDGESKAIDVLRDKCHLDLPAIKNRLESRLRRDVDGSAFNYASKDIAFNDKSNGVLRLCILESRLMRSKTADVEHLLLAIMKQKDNLPALFLEDSNVNYNQLYDYFSQPTPAPKANVGFDDEEDEEMDMPPRSRGGQGENRQQATRTEKKGKGTDTPAIDQFGFDLTRAAREGKLDPVVGREKEIERVAQILSRRKKNNPVLIGEPGVGKSAIVEGLAQRINERKVSRTLFNKRLITLDMTSVVAGTKYRGQFEERMKSIIAELKANPDIIVFIDEIHTLVGAGNQAGTMDAANMMKPALSRGELQCIGATTLDEYRKSIEKDGALERRFQKIIVDPTTMEETLEILHNIKDRYEEHHNVSYTEEALQACVKLTERYVTDRHFPDKAIDALDEAGSRVHINNVTVPKEIEDKEKAIAEANANKEKAVKNQNYELAANYRDRVVHLESELEEMRAQWEASLVENRETVDEEKVAETVSLMTGIPVQRMAAAEGIRMKGMKSELKSKVIGQDQAIDKLVSAIQRSRVGLNDPNRPIGTFMFLGPTGVGKTYLAKKLAEHMFGTSDALIRIDMSEYMEKFTVSRLVGAPPGYVGYEEGGMLTERVRRKPYSIVLLDEIEKAHPDVFNILLQVMDDGRLTDSNGRTVDFRNTVIIMTSNAGTRQLKEFGRGVGFAAMQGVNDKEMSRSVVRKALEKLFAPEFLNRIDEIITFDQLDLDSIITIIDQEINPLQQRIENLGFHFSIDAETKRFIAEKGYDKQFGARPLCRAIQSHLEDGLSELIVENDIEEGSTIVAKLNEAKDKVIFEVIKNE